MNNKAFLVPLTLAAFLGLPLHQRTLLDLVATAKLTGALDVAFEGYIGRQELPGSDTPSWTSFTSL